MARNLVGTDNFNRAALGADWSQRNASNGSVQINANTVVTGSAFGVMGYAKYVGALAGSIGNDHYVSLAITGAPTGTANYGMSVHMRVSDDVDGARDCYFVRLSDQLYLGKIVNGVETILASGGGPTWANGDRLEGEAEGTTIRACRNGTPIGGAYTVTDTSLTTGGVGIGSMGDPGICSGDNVEFGTLAAASNLSGGATLDGPTAAGGMNSPNNLTGNADLGGVSAGGALDAPNSLSGGAALDGPTAGGGLSGASNLAGDAALDGVSASGTLGSAPGTLTSSDLKFNNGAVHSNVPFEAFISVPSTGALVLRKTGLTSTTSGTAPKCAFTDAALTPGTQYRVTWRRTDTGAEGTEILTAT